MNHLKKFLLKSICLICIVSFSDVAEAQNGSEEIGFPSPTAASLGIYGETPVSLYTGSINPSIPVHVSPSSKLSLPITLTYNGSGVKVSEIPGWVGLSWALEAGGVITRVVRGKPDDQSSIGYLATKDLLEEFIDNVGTDPNNGCTSFSNNSCEYYFWDKLELGQADSEPDHFYINFPGGSGKFYLGLDGQPVMNDYSPLKITYDSPSGQTFVGGGEFGGNENFQGIPSWEVIDADGNTYTFSAKEYSYDKTDWTQINDNRPYISAWYLTKIESASGKDEITISYTSPTVITRYLTKFNNKYVEYNTTCFEDQSTSKTYRTRYGLIWPEEINTATEKITFSTSTKTNDVLGEGEERLNAINVYDKSDNLKRKFVLSYDTLWSDRTLLTAIQEEDHNENKKPAQQFEYYKGTNLPEIDSPNIDHWGYSNGAGNSTLIPSMVIPNLVSYIGANRRVNESQTNLGMLKKIIYPTGGSSTFEYENHDFGSVGGDDINTSYTSEEGEVEETGLQEVIYKEVPFLVADADNSDVLIEITSTINNSTTTTPHSYTRILDSGDNEMFKHQHGGTGISNKQEAKLFPPGDYTLIVDDTNSDGYVSINIDWVNSFPPSGQSPDVLEIAGGPRIKKIINSDGMSSSNDIVKEYVYRLENESTRSSGVLTRKPKYYYNSSNAYGFDYGGHSCSYIALTAQSILPFGSNGGKVEYREVKEVVHSASEYGYTYYKYNTSYNSGFGDDAWDVDTWPYSIIGDRSQLRGGLNNTLIYSSTNSLFNKKSITYTIEKSGMVNGMGFKVDKFESNHKSVVYYIYDNYLYWQPKTLQKEYIYNALVAETELEYNSTNHQPSIKTETNSNDEERVTEYKYAYEIYDGTDEMKDLNMLTQPYSVTIKDGVADTLVSKTWTLWKEWEDEQWLPCGKWAWNGGTVTPPANCNSN